MADSPLLKPRNAEPDTSPRTTISAEQALANASVNRHGKWGASAAPEDAARRTFQGIAEVQAAYDGPRLAKGDGVFAIGSCFAREVETHLALQGSRVLSLEPALQRTPEFLDADGRYRSSYFHRYTPQSLAQEVVCALGDEPAWDDETSLIFESGDRAFDFNYGWTETGDRTLQAALARRRAVLEITRRVVQARCVIVTLGLIEAWRHVPSGLYCNKAHPRLLRARPGEFELAVTSYDETLAQLRRLGSTLDRRAGDEIQLVVTVSPVPLQQTFRPMDVVIANAESKAVLRAATAEFVRRRDNAHYFPSYEMVAFSRPDLAWQDDGVHVQSRLVKSIVTRFTRLYFAEGELAARPSSG